MQRHGSLRNAPVAPPRGNAATGEVAIPAGAEALHDLHVDAASVGFIAHLKLREDVRHGARMKQRVCHVATYLNEATNTVGEIVG
jgi:hypothetical protein